MGSGVYSSSAHYIRASTLGYDTKSTGEVFAARTVNSAMNPHGVRLRESRDSAEHPKSVGIIIALDVTGSMGTVPHYLVKNGLPNIMDSIIKGGVNDPQVLFMGIGDHECDQFPLQVGQFESSDELLDKWLTDTYLEGGGGGNLGESYLLAWYFAGYHTALDCHEKKRQKGLLFTIGDEPVLKSVPKGALTNIMGAGQYEDFTAARLLEKAREMYEVFHIHIGETSSGARREVLDSWKQVMGDKVVVANRHEEVAGIISQLVLAHSNHSSGNSSQKDSPSIPSSL